MELKRLIEQRNDIYGKMSDIIKAATTENRSCTDEELNTYNGYKAKLTALDATIGAAEAIRDGERREQRPAASNGLTAEERSFVAYLRNPSAVRADANTGSSNAGVVIPKKVSDRIVEIAKNVSPVFAMATTYRVKGQLVIPCEDSSSTIAAVYADDFASIDATAQKLSSITLTGYTLRALAKVSRSLMNNSDIDILSYVTRKIGEALATKIEREYLIGTSNKVSGIAGTVTQTITAASSKAITADELIELQDSVPDVYQANAIWVMNPKTRTAIRKLKNNDGDYLLQRDYTGRWNYMLLGKPVYVSDNMPEAAAGVKSIYYGDLSGLASKVAEDIEIQVLYERYAEQHAVGVVGFAEIDAKIENPQKISALVMKASA